MSFENIDYEYLKSFDKKQLIDSLIIPMKKDGIYFYCYYCNESNIDLLTVSHIFRKKLINKQEILFFLNDIDTRIKLFDLSEKSKKSSENDLNYINSFFQILLEKSILNRTSDIHIESKENSLEIRFRIDGTLKVFYSFCKSFSKVLSSYIKMVSKLDITNFRTPMDGRFSFEVKDAKYDFRVSTMPIINGESIVIRILDNNTVEKDIEKLGFSNHIIDSFKEIETLRQGLVLITGPTGSGKSTTLYSLLKKLSSSKKKVITIEDPVEYKLESIQQIEVNDEIELGYDTVLRNILRQDPDIILIGEIRDEISLNIALQASLTGHLVLASIHANNSFETINRLIDLKADRYLLANTLKYVISQRLVLNICQNCLKKGCQKCNFTGFLGRSSLGEVLKNDKNLSPYIIKNENIDEYLSKISFKSLLDDGKQKVKDGITTISEVYKVVEKV
jgi:general secretion pathway protein E